MAETFDVRFRSGVIFLDGVAVAEFIPRNTAPHNVNGDMTAKFKRFLNEKSDAIAPGIASEPMVNK